MSVPAYPAYKDSGVEWLGELPAHWQVVPLKHLARFSGGGTPSRDKPAYWNGDIPWVSPKDMKVELISETEEFITAEGLAGSASSLVAPGAVLVVVRSGILRHTIPVAINSKPVALNQDMKAISVDHSRYRADYLARFIQGLNSTLLPLWLKLGATVESIEFAYMADTPCPVPPLAEQAAIAAFLDRETGKIDALVVEQRRLIALLKEKRQAVISHAVTKGLNPQAPLKPSGIEWLGDIPAHWDVRKLTNIARLESGHTPSRQRPDYWVEEDCVIPWFTLADVGQLRGGRNLRVRETSQRISEIGMANSAARLLPKGTVILSRTASVGFPGITEIDLAVSQDFAAWICRPALEPDYLLFTLQAMGQEFDRLMMGSTHQTIYMPDIEAFRIPVPPPDEQLEIAKQIASVLTRLDALSDGCEQAQRLLQERRAALISAAVTGKIDVRGLVASSGALEAA